VLEGRNYERRFGGFDRFGAEYQKGHREMSSKHPKRQVVGGNAEGLPISAAVKFGDLVFVSGTVGFDNQNRLVPGGVGAETRQIFRNIGKVLEEAGSRMEDILKVNVILADAGDFDEFNAAYAAFFPNQPPARVTMAASLTIDARLEVDVIAGASRNRS
jgi:2-iminobutanoate/2-iminopropanoate deaminase